MKKTLLILTFLTGLLQSCVVTKEVYVSELQRNFKEQQDKFLTQRGLDSSENHLTVYYSDETVDKEYDVVSYNHMKSFIPFRQLRYNRWQIKYRIHQYMHNAYCLGILGSIDAMIVDADLSGVKYIRYKNSSKEEFIIPKKQSYAKGLSGGVGIKLPRVTTLTGSYNFSRDINCLESIRHEFGFLYGIRMKETSNDGNIESIFKEGGFFSFNYKYVFAYNVSEYFSNTWNMGSGKHPLFTEIGLDVNFLDINSNSNIMKNGSTEISSNKVRNTSIFGLGAYLGLRYKISPSLGVNLGMSTNPIKLLNYTSNKVSDETTTELISKIDFNYDAIIPKMYLRFFYAF